MSQHHSSAIVPATPRPIIVQKNRERQLTGDEIELLKRTVCKGASDDEFALFLWTCKKHKLDPITKQIYAVFRNVTKHHQDEKGIWVAGRQMTIQMGIDGLRSLASRHHKDFGGCDEPSFTMSDMRTPAGRPIPESVAVRLWKKGLEHPIVGVAYWDEFAPRDLSESKADFYNRMPRLMLAKCAEAQAIRKGYPDLSDIYVDEEMVQADQDYTPEGRIITDANGFTASGQAVTYDAKRQIAKEAQQQVLDEKLAHGHQPGTEKAKQAEETLKRVEEADAKLKEQKSPGSNPGREAAHVASGSTEAGGLKPPAAKASMPADKPRGTIELDLTTPDDPIIRGDIGDLLELIQKHCKAEWRGDWWHILPADVATIHAMGQQLNYRVIEMLPKVPSQGKGAAPKGESNRPLTQTNVAAPKDSAKKEEPKTTTAGVGGTSSAATSAGPIVVKGVIEQFVEKMTKGQRANPEKGKKGRPSVPYLTVLIKTEKGTQWVSAFDHKLFPFIQKGKLAKQGTFVVQKSGDFWNLLGFRTLENLTFDDDNVTTCIQRDREPGNPNLFTE